MATLTTDTAAPTNPQTISNENGTHNIEQGPDSYNTTDLIMDAHRDGFIYIDDLVVVFSCETGFTEKHLPGLWEKFDLKKKGGDFGPLSDSRWRFNRWMRLLYRIAFGISIDKSRVDVLSASRFRKLVPKHKYDNGEYLPADLSHFKQGGHSYGECFIKIEDLRDYLVNYAGIPAEDLPGSLFPPVVTSEESTGQRPGEATLSHDALKNRDQGKGFENPFAISNEIGLKWSDVKVTFISDIEILFQFKNTGVTRNYANLGFQDQRTKRPIGAWAVLHRASKTGIIPWAYDNRTIVEKKAQEIRKKFRALFPSIDGDPVVINGHKMDKGYRFAFDLKNTEADEID